MIKAIALDDEPLALNVIETYCNKISSIQLLAKFTSQEEALAFLKKHQVEVLFLDINMPKSTGIDFCNALTQKYKVVFTTAFSQYAVEGFNLNASDYLLKPFSIDRFKVAVQKVEHEINLEQNASSSINDYLVIKADYKLHQINYNDIIYIEALDDYIKIYLEDEKKIVARHTMKRILEKLPSTLFKRTHRSYIVSLNKITTLQKDSILINNITIPLSSTYKDNILKNFHL
ncbi:two component transcriptional regulator, LytTR family [Mesonia phycicola]|uniref:Two component transcriptional regulator, LytTR family n=1 Tax=Mesonia phycicola TaxID=579105 RepID=A0A1M6H089_9FLAO|nr:LytTR family DNA-binding domain-containing protein [Mesonia phycicola]SHJ15575.1 two component transcriptional regulator, LytTR family [Mesonia phycicola]